jgi:hypothetical protein
MFRVVQRRPMSHTDMGIVGATSDRFILFENGLRRNRLALPGCAAWSQCHWADCVVNSDQAAAASSALS